jgi:SbcC/RAD50-like, Walker B motif
MAAESLPFPDRVRPSSGDPDRFARRWHLVGAGLSNVWRFGDLLLPARSGRLLLRGPNGTGKTTALEGLCPYLLDLNAARLPAGKSRTTSLRSLMETGATGKRRYGYLWLEVASPGETQVLSFGVRLQYSQGSSPAVTVIPFYLPGRPVIDLPLHGADRAPLSLDDFTAGVEARGGEVFAEPEQYIARLGVLVVQQSPEDIRLLAERMRQVRNPTLLGEVSPREAAEALRASLPGVDRDVVAATAEALAESETTRNAFRRDSEAADVLTDFAEVWAGHVVDAVHAAHAEAAERQATANRLRAKARRAAVAATAARTARKKADTALESVRERLTDAQARIEAAEKSEEYKAAGRLDDLRQRADALADNAAVQVVRLREAARSAERHGQQLRRQVEQLREDVDEQVAAAEAEDPAARPDAPLVSFVTVARPVFTAGGHSIDAGPSLRVDASLDRLTETAQRWQALGERRRSRADAAEITLSDHRQTVETADRAAAAAETQHGHDATVADEAAVVARRAAQAAARQVEALAAELVSWTTADTTMDGAGWSAADAYALGSAEPAEALDRANEWAESIRQFATEAATALTSRAEAAAGEAEELYGRAAAGREQARQLRAGRLLPLPRPEWAGEADDATAFGAALEWADGVADERERALVETALTAAGVLGATLGDDDAARTAMWAVTASGTGEANRSLAELVTVDPTHPRAAAAAAILARIAVADRAQDAELGQHLLIGADGSFRAGVLSGRAPGADDTAALPPATHVGARQRRRAALAQADSLDRQAEELEAQAAELTAAAEHLAAQARHLQARARGFPRRDPLSRAEAKRSAQATSAREAAETAEKSGQRARQLRTAHRAEREGWAARTRACDLPLDLAELATVRDTGLAAAKVLHACADTLRGKFAARLRDALADARAADQHHATLGPLAAAARIAHDKATRAEAELDELQRTVGAPAERILAELAAARREEQTAREELESNDQTARDLAEKQVEAAKVLEHAEELAAHSEPAALSSRRQLRALVDAPGVRAALGLDASTGPDDGTLLETVQEGLTGRRTNARKTVRERYDNARALLAGTWALDPGDSYGELDTYVLTHQDQPYTPHAAALRAQALKERAQNALAAAEEKALREFVIGRLPRAIGLAWQRLFDWNHQVNRKMKIAAASSGVGVQVRIAVRDDLSAATRTVYELACRIADADRLPSQQEQVGQALQSLIGAADGEDMLERVAAAVDVRDWVTVRYYVERPGQAPQPWGSRTGLSGGERRLVVLAPMLAAVAAGYDRGEDSGLRLAALDEVPAEVDEEGRTGLARYLGELDLDLICTSYLWDGAPGAWDGLDAHDLEADADGMVVAFPMLVRGLLDLPGDHPGLAPADAVMQAKPEPA